MSKYSSACDIMCDTWYGPCGGYREFSYASSQWDAMMGVLGDMRTEDEVWDVICADLEGAYFCDEYGEKELGDGIWVVVERIADDMDAFDVSYMRFIKDGNIIMELSAEADSEMDTTSGISVLCDNLFARLKA